MRPIVYRVLITMPGEFPAPTRYARFALRTRRPWLAYSLALRFARRRVTAGDAYMVSLDVPTIRETGHYRTHTYSPLMVAR